MFNTANEQSQRAFYLGLAALLAEKVYNFGELVSWVEYVVPFIMNKQTNV